MKKIISFILALCLLLPAAMADNSKALQKARNKERKEVMKRLKKENWKIFGSSRSLEVALLSHWDKLDKEGENAREVFGVSTRSQSKNVGQQMAINNACLTYAQQAGSQLQGRVASDISGNGSDASSEFEHFYAAYERAVEKEIRGEMQQSFSLIRENADGTFEIETYFIVNEDAASKARLRALENAMKESEAAQNHAEMISKFVREGFTE